MKTKQVCLQWFCTACDHSFRECTSMATYVIGTEFVICPICNLDVCSHGEPIDGYEN